MNERDLALRVSGQGFLGSYVEYARGLTAAPLVYHVATGLSIVSGAVGSNVSFTGAGDTEYWPNLYNLQLGPSGVHKTTAMNVGLEVLRRAAPGAIYSDQYSQEQFVKGLQARPARLLAVEEFATLLADMDRSYMVGMKEMLTKIYDPRQEFVRSLRNEEIRLIRPSITILGASTIDWLVAHLKEVDFISGFMPRFLLWPSELKEPEPPGGALAKADKALKDSLVIQLAAIARVRGARAEFSPEAIKIIKRFSDERMRRKLEEGAPKEMDGLLSRCGNYSAKLCVLLCLADDGMQLGYTVDDETAKRATLLMGWLLDKALELFETYIVWERDERELQKVLRLIPDNGIAWQDLLKRSKRMKEILNKMVSTLEERGEVKQESKATATKTGRYIYRAYPELNGTGKDSKFSEGLGEGFETVVPIRQSQEDT